MKSTSTFKMNKTTKRMLSLFPFPDQKSLTHFRKHMIMSQLISEQAQRTVQKNSKDTDQA